MNIFFIIWNLYLISKIMKGKFIASFAIFAFLNSSKVSAVKLRDIFDAYDDEALIEANS